MQGNVSLLFNFIPKTRRALLLFPNFNSWRGVVAVECVVPVILDVWSTAGITILTSRYVVGLCRCLVRMRRRLQCACEGEVVLGNAGRKFQFPLPTAAPVYTILIFFIELLLKNAHLSSNLSNPGFHDEIQLPVVSRTKFPDAHMAKINKIIIFAFLFICSIWCCKIPLVGAWGSDAGNFHRAWAVTLEISIGSIGLVCSDAGNFHRLCGQWRWTFPSAWAVMLEMSIGTLRLEISSKVGVLRLEISIWCSVLGKFPSVISEIYQYFVWHWVRWKKQ